MPLDTSKPFTRKQALFAGLTVDELAGPRFQRLFHGLYLSAGIRVTVLERARAALSVSARGSYASHQTAAAIWTSAATGDGETHISVPLGSPRSKRLGICAHRAPASAVTVTHQGLLLSPPTQTFLELAAARIDLVDLVVFGDALVRANQTTTALLSQAVGMWCGAGARLARRAAALVRAGVDSPAETRLRMLVVLAGLPEPEVNVIVRKDDGSWARRFDLAYPDLMLIIEYDGRHHERDLQQWSNDILRREELEALGWRLIVVNADALFNQPTLTLHRIRTALIERGQSDLKRRLPPAWARHFSDRSYAA